MDFYLTKFNSAKNDQVNASYWHDIDLTASNPNQPLRKSDVYNMVVEIPKFATAKYEISLNRPFNPILHDMKHGLPRNYFGPIYWNQGALPQTWENPNKLTDFHGNQQQGDGDPLDAVEIGEEILHTGDVVEVKALGALAMIDDGALDWKLIVVSTSSPLAKFNCVEELEQSEQKWVLANIREWFRTYKQSDGIINKFENDEQQLNAAETAGLITECHEEWHKYHEQVDQQMNMDNVQKETDIKATNGINGHLDKELSNGNNIPTVNLKESFDSNLDTET